MPLGRAAHTARHSKFAPEPWRPDSTLDALYRDHAPAARRYASTLTRSHDDADDLVAETFLRALWAIRRGHGPETPVRSYLFAAMRRIQGEARRPPVVHADEDSSPEAGEPDPGASSGERPEPITPGHSEAVDRDAVTEAFRALPARWQGVLVLMTVEDLSLDEVAERLGISPGAASVLAFRAREGLRASYLQHGVPVATDEACRAVRERLGRWARGTLSAREQRRVDEHLRTCVDCDAAALWVTEESSRMRLVGIPVLMAAVWPSAKSLAAIGAVGAVGITAPGALKVSRGALAAAGAVIVAGIVGAAMALSPVGSPSREGAKATPGGSSSGFGVGASPAFPGSGLGSTSRTSTATPSTTVTTATTSATSSTSSNSSSSTSSGSSSARSAASSRVTVAFSNGQTSSVVWSSTQRTGTILELIGLPDGTSIGVSGASCSASSKSIDFTCTVAKVSTTSIYLSAGGWSCGSVSTSNSGNNPGIEVPRRLRFDCSRL